MKPIEALTLYELNSLVRQTLYRSMDSEYWICAELSDVRVNQNGNCYLEFIQKDTKTNNFLAKARGIIWADEWYALKAYFEKTTGQPFVSGIKVQVAVAVVFHELYGYSLTVHDINPDYTLGDMVRRRRQILQQIETDGISTMNKDLSLPLSIQRVAVISSSTAAGYGDFCRQLIDNSGKLVFYVHLFEALMQGTQVESSILSALDMINANRDLFDVVVIIRGGGATSDLSGFETYPLAAACAQFPLPIITGIGHERDDTVIDIVAHTRVKTPTAAAQLLIEHQESLLYLLGDMAVTIRDRTTACIEVEKERLNRLAGRSLQGIPARVDNEGMRLELLTQRFRAGVEVKLSNARHLLEGVTDRINFGLKEKLTKEQNRLTLLQQQLDGASPERLLKRGYSLTYLNGVVLTDLREVHENDEIKTLMKQGLIFSKVTKIEQHG